jgi:hypothetical protein
MGRLRTTDYGGRVKFLEMYSSNLCLHFLSRTRVHITKQSQCLMANKNNE